VENLIVYSMLYAFAESFFFSVFILNYRPELMLTLPFVAAAFAWYLRIGMKPESAAQTPERLYQERAFLAYLIIVASLMVLAFMVDVPLVAELLRASSASGG
jgi:hypothetical protein